MMMEMRWLEYESKTNPVTGEHFSMPSKYRKLQFRTQIMQFTASLRRISEHHYEEVEKPCGWQWSDWKDVPVARE